MARTTTRALALLLLLLAACNPWTPVHEREAPWWGSAAALQDQTGVELVALPAGEPVGYWPRVVVGTDAIEVDNRAWFLSLPEWVFEELEPEDLARLLVERRIALEVGEAQASEDALRGMLIVPLYDTLMELAEAAKWMAEADEALEFDDTVLVLPAPGVPTRTLSQVLYTAGQSQLGGATLGGVVEDRVRRVGAAGDAAACAGMVTAGATAEGPTLSSGGRSLSLDGACTSGAPGDTLDRLVALCHPRWQERVEAVLAAAPSADPLPEARWGCVTLLTHLGGDGRAEDLLLALSQAYARRATVRQAYYLAGGASGCADPVDLTQPLDDATLDQVCDIRRLQDLLDAWAEGNPRAGQVVWMPRLQIGAARGTSEPLNTEELLRVFHDVEGLDVLDSLLKPPGEEAP